MTKHFGLIGLAALSLSLPVHGQYIEREATLFNNMNEVKVSGPNAAAGKCTIEVQVDKSAEVTIFGDHGAIRTTGGAPAAWQRFECTGALPVDPHEFRLVGGQGDGQVKLVSEPRAKQGGPTQGSAVIAIINSQGGARNYAFDIEWHGGHQVGDWEQFRGQLERLNPPAEVASFKGVGQGTIDGSGLHNKIGEANLSVEPDHDIRAEFKTEDGQMFGMTGLVTQMGVNRIVAQLSGGGLYGTATIEVDAGRIKSITLDGGDTDNPIKLRWHN